MTPTDNHIVPVANADASNKVVALPTRLEPATPAEKALVFVKAHPVLTVAGGLATGLLISSLLPRRANRSMTMRALRLAEAGASVALGFGQDAFDKAEDGGVLARKKAKVLARQAEKLSERVATHAERFGASAADRAEHLGKKAAVSAERLGVVALGAASSLGHAAADRADKLGHATAVHAESLGGRASDRLSQFGDLALVQSSKIFGYPKARSSLGDRLMAAFHGLRGRLRG